MNRRPDPDGCALPPVAFSAACMVGAATWIFLFKGLSALCRLMP